MQVPRMPSRVWSSERRVAVLLPGWGRGVCCCSHSCSRVFLEGLMTLLCFPPPESQDRPGDEGSGGKDNQHHIQI